MENVMNLIKAVDENTHQYDDFILNLLSKHSDLPFDNDEIDTLINSIISNVNSRLNQIITRYDGLNILLCILPKCSRDILTKYATLWISKAIQILESNQSDIRELTLACQILSSLTVSCKEISELQKQISMQTLKQLVTIITNMEQNRRCGAIYYLLATLMYHYKESSEKFQIILKKLILSIIDDKEINLVQCGANCFALLARATERTFKPPSIKPMYNSWIYNQSLICNSLHYIMDDLFSDVMEMETIDIWAKLELPKIPESNLFDYYFKLERRFENLSIFLTTMLRGCAGRNSVCPTDILKVLCRGLAITPNILQKDTFKHQMLGFILPKLHINLLMILNSLINGFRQDLLPYANTILKLYTQTLKWCDNIQHNKVTISGSKPFKSVKIAIYKSLSLWLTHLTNLSVIEIVTDEIIPCILKDITPEKDQVLLTVEKTQNLSKRALKRFRDSQYENSAVLGRQTVSHTDKETLANVDLCNNALCTLENLIYNSVSLIKIPLYRNIERLIVMLLYDVYLATDDTSFYKKNHNCRDNLLKVLRAIQMNPHPLLPPPTQYSIELFTLAMNDEKIELVNQAKLSLVEIEKIVHPCAATLQFPLINDKYKKNDEQSQSQCSFDDILSNRTEQKSSNIDDDDDDDITVESVYSVRESADKIDKVKDNDEKNEDTEIINVISNGNCDEPIPTKQRKLEIIDNNCDISPIHYTNNDKCRTINKEIVVSNLQNNKSTTDTSSAKILNKNNSDNSESVLNKSHQEHNVIPGLEHDSEDDAILGLFCDELKDNNN